MPSAAIHVPTPFPPTPNHTGPTLNAISSPDRTARRARNLATCEELVELGMDLARAAHREALRDMQPPPAPRTPIPGLTYASLPEAPPRDTVFGQLFTAISRCVRQTVLLDDRLAAGIDHSSPEPAPRAVQPQVPGPAPPDSPRTCPDHLYREVLDDECLRQDPRPVEDILAHIRTELGAAPACLAAHRPPAASHPRRPIPIIPPGPQPRLSVLERSALLHHQTHPPKPPD